VTFVFVGNATWVGQNWAGGDSRVRIPYWEGRPPGLIARGEV